MRTARLRLDRVELDDLDALFGINSDPRVWLHFPTLRHTDRAQTLTVIKGWRRSWVRAGLGAWTARGIDDDRVVGYGGCWALGAHAWNLGYRLAAAEHGNGFATELAQAAVAAAHTIAPERAVIAYLVEHNTASARVAEKVGLTLVDRSPDAGNPDPRVQRLIYADRELSSGQLAAARR